MQYQSLATLDPDNTAKYTPRQNYTTPITENSCDPCAKPEPTCPEVACVDECGRPVRSSSWGYGWGWLGQLILWFIVLTVLFWLIFYSLKPTFVLQSDSNQVDTAKVLLAAVIAAFILVIIIWLIMAAVRR